MIWKTADNNRRFIEEMFDLTPCKQPRKDKKCNKSEDINDKCHKTYLDCQCLKYQRLARKLNKLRWNKLSTSAYINFVRHYRKKYPCKPMIQIVCETKNIWKKMSKLCKQPFLEQAYKALEKLEKQQ
ncbi:hypothetical protein O3M35_001801 [Rhynocoris fuscipes]|uniref:Uncharacterized protein n=1 Tax=Rhynocoris fuscipes TaxID=488301 RepID=A0AAW1CQF2_9HEMI